MATHNETMVMNDIRRMHYSLSREEYDKIKEESYSKWRSCNLGEFTEYFTKQWDGDRWSTWQIFYTPPGFASTNNPVEACNKFLKQQFTRYHSLTVLEAVTMLVDKIIPYYCVASNQTTYATFRKPDKVLKVRANKLNAAKFHRSDISPNIVRYYGFDELITIDVDLRICSCRWFNAYACCQHNYRAMILYDIQFDQARFVNRTRHRKTVAVVPVATDHLLGIQCLVNCYRVMCLSLPPIDLSTCLSSAPTTPVFVAPLPIVTPSQPLPVVRRGVGRPRKVKPALEFATQ